MSDSDAMLYGYLSSRGLSIIRFNAPEKLLLTEQSLAELLSEAYSIASKGEDTPDKLAALLIITEKFAGLDVFRGFDALTDTVKTLNRISDRPVSLSSLLDRSPVTIEFTTKISYKEMTAGEKITLESLDFHEVEALAGRDYTRTRMLGESIENKILRAKYLIAVASKVLNHSPQARAETAASK